MIIFAAVCNELCFANREVTPGPPQLFHIAPACGRSRFSSTLHRAANSETEIYCFSKVLDFLKLPRLCSVVLGDMVVFVSSRYSDSETSWIVSEPAYARDGSQCISRAIGAIDQGAM